MKLFHRIAKAFFVALTLFALATGGALAQRDKKDEKENPFPNATRKDPKELRLDERTQKKIQGAFDDLSAGDFDKAQKALEEVLAAKKVSAYGQALAYQGLSQAAWEQDDVAKALEYNEKAVQSNALPNDAHFNSLYQLAQMNLMEENYDATLKWMDEWMKLSGKETAEAYSIKGNALYRMERYDDAAVAMRKAISMSDKPQSSWNQILVATYYEADKFPEAAAAVQELLQKTPNDKQLMQQLANIYMEMEQNDKALATLEQAYNAGVLTDAKDLKQLYQMYNYLEAPAKAAEVINAGLAKGVLPQDAETWKGLADSYALLAEAIENDTDPKRKELMTKAVEAYGKAATMTSGNGELDFQRGHMLVELEKWTDAKAALQSAMSKGGLKREGEAWILMGTAEYELGNQAAAIAAYEKARSFENTRSMADAWLKAVRQ